MEGGLRYQYARLNVAEKLIAINCVVFIVFGLLGKIYPTLENWFVLPADFMSFLNQPWSIITYSFLHAGIFHLLWNMYVLYFTSKILLNLFDGKRFLNIYFLGVILGGAFYMITSSLFASGGGGVLLGASAGVMAVLIFVCTYIPNQEVRIVFFNVKLWHVGVFVVLIDLLQISSGGDNIGGRIAHLGGALLGYVYAKQLFQGRDIGTGFSKFVDGLVNVFKVKESKAPLKTVYKKKKATGKSKINYSKDAHQRKIDIILDKISKSGYESLSKAEKDFLFKAGKKD